MTRRSEPAKEAVLDAVHAKLGTIRVDLNPDPSSTDLRELFSRIRCDRNVVARILASLLPRLALLRADLVRLDRTIEREGAAIMDSGEGLLGATNDRLRAFRLKVVLSDEHDMRAAVKEDLVLVDEVVSHSRLVREELRFAFEEASRALASIEFEWKVETR